MSKKRFELNPDLKSFNDYHDKVIHPLDDCVELLNALDNQVKSQGYVIKHYQDSNEHLFLENQSLKKMVNDDDFKLKVKSVLELQYRIAYQFKKGDVERTILNISKSLGIELDSDVLKDLIL